MAANAINSLTEDFLHCSICTEPYNEPKVLPCLHSFCLQCLKQWASNHRGQTFPCPTCRCDVIVPRPGVNGLPNNFFLVSLKERLDEVRSISIKSSDFTCNICKSKVDILFCLDCMMHICKGCKETHDRFTRSSDHPLVEPHKMSDESYLKRVMSTQTPYCGTHKQEKVHFYCSQCSQLACQICAMVSHQGHKSLEEVKNKVTSIKTNLETLLKKSTDDLETLAKRSKEEAKKRDKTNEQISVIYPKIDASYEELLKKVQADKEELLAQLDNIETRICAKLNGIDIKFSESLNAIKYFQITTRKILEQDNPWEILQMEMSVVESFQRLQPDKVQMTELSIPDTVKHDFLPAKIFIVEQQHGYHYDSLSQRRWNRLSSHSDRPNEVLRACIQDLNEKLRVLKRKESILKNLSDVNFLGTVKR